MTTRKFTLTILLALCGLLCMSASAFAAAPEEPETLKPSEPVPATTAVFSGVVNPKITAMAEAGEYEFLYKAINAPAEATKAHCESAGASTAPVPAGAYLGATAEPFPQEVTGLTQDTEYVVCLAATNTTNPPHVRTVGNPVAFTTGTPEPPTVSEPTLIMSATATLHGVLNPKHAGVAGTYEFLYNHSAMSCEGGLVAPEPPETAAATEGKAVEAPIAGLEPGGTYTVCLRATNAASETATSAPVTFQALSVAPTVVPESTSTTKVAGTSAVLSAEINPGGGETTYRFEYGINSIGEHDTAESVLNGSDNNAHPGSILVQGLQPGTTYHYRVLASNESAPAPGGVPGLEATFTTQTQGGEFKLPDDRAWEQVSPTDKYGARIEAISKEGAVIQSAVDGSALTYVTAAPAVPNPEGNPALGESQMISTRSSAGVWSSRDIATPHEVATFAPPLGHVSEYVAFSPDLSRGVIERHNAKEVSLSPADKEPTLYLREGLREAGGSQYVPLFTDEELVGASNNLEHVVFENLKEWNRATGILDPVAILPDGTATVGSLGGGGEGYNIRNAVSENGERVFWENVPGQAETNLYVREGIGTPQAHTVQIDLPQREVTATGSAEANFQYATPEGTKVYFTDGQRLTADATAQPHRPELYEYDFNKQPGERLTDLTPDLEADTSINVQGEVEVAENGEYVYFVATGSLDGAPVGKGTECNGTEPSSTCNLYVAHVEGGKVTMNLIAVLSGEDARDWIGNGTESADLSKITSRVSPNGHYLAFMSDRGLTGYDNTDVNEEKYKSREGNQHADEEMFVYDALTQHLACASCDPSGARPHGVFDIKESGEGLGLLVDRLEIWKNRWLAGSVPGWTRLSEKKALYQSRYLSNEGRLFFDAADGLVPQDTNGKEDVYEYEPAGLGPEHASCGPESTGGSEVYKPGSTVEVEGRPVQEGAGCVALISSGESAEESAFLDASGIGEGGEEGEDVFFLTSSKLSTQDMDSADDVYDAHICSTAVPCASGSAVSPSCSTTDSCRVAPAAQPAIFGASGSATFAGAGNFAASTTPAVKKKSLTRAQKLAAALKVCKKKSRKQRAGCERQARQRFGATKPRKGKKAGNERRTIR
jgi:hypothetical protein